MYRAEIPEIVYGGKGNLDGISGEDTQDEYTEVRTT
jgi:hypothetical protein